MKPIASFTASMCLVLQAGAAVALSPQTDAAAGMRAFANNCFSPFLTAEKATRAFSLANLRYDFYDLDPFSDVAPSPVKGKAATPGTDRRCEVAFDLDFTKQAVRAANDALISEGITTPAQVPAAFKETEGTALLAARHLNPNRIAVVHVGTRSGTNGTETFMSVERLVPLNQ